MFLVESYVVDGNAKGINILSRFADVQCKLLMTVGRTPSTNMRECVDRTQNNSFGAMGKMIDDTAFSIPLMLQRPNGRLLALNLAWFSTSNS
jgi:hypothetical protein